MHHPLWWIMEYTLRSARFIFTRAKICFRFLAQKIFTRSRRTLVECNTIFGIRLEMWADQNGKIDLSKEGWNVWLIEIIYLSNYYYVWYDILKTFNKNKYFCKSDFHMYSTREKIFLKIYICNKSIFKKGIICFFLLIQYSIFDT